MNAVGCSFRHWLNSIKKDRMLSAAALAPLAAGMLFKFGIPAAEPFLISRSWLTKGFSPYYPLLDLLLAVLTPVMICFIAAMVMLEERDERTAVYFYVTPLGRKGYFLSRLGLPALISAAAELLLLPMFSLSGLSFTMMLGMTAAGTLQGLIIALLIISVSSNQLEGMAAAKLSSLICTGLTGPFFLTPEIQRFLMPLPSYWLAMAAAESSLTALIPTFGLSMLYIGILFHRYLQKY